jgi:peptidoglycan lytic transglycosylase G
MAEGGERSAAEREAARLERERRRARADGGGRFVPPQQGEALPPEEGDPLTADHGDHLEWDDESEVASGTRRVARLDRPPPPRRPPARPRKAPARHSRVGRIISLVALVLAAALVWFLVELFQPFHGSGHGAVTVTIPPHSTSSQVGNLLERDGVIASSFFFELRATLAGDRSALRSGTYHLRLDMSYGDVLKVVTTPPPPARVSSLTLTEGRTRREIDGLLRSQGIRGSYLAATRHSPLLSPTRYGAPRDTPSLEGFLFPSTYQLRDPIAISDLVADQLRTFRQRFSTVSLRFARGKHLTPYDVLIIASMVEAEAQTAHDRPLIASVIYNRLADGMPLQIDATTRYATGNYTRPLTVSELDSPSPYNTRIHKGLPPTPINNPGLASIGAAAHPASTNYLYFVVKPCGNGAHAFASSYSQFLAEVQQYQTARTERGGRSPSKC